MISLDHQRESLSKNLQVFFQISFFCLVDVLMKEVKPLKSSQPSIKSHFNTWKKKVYLVLFEVYHKNGYRMATIVVCLSTKLLLILHIYQNKWRTDSPPNDIEYIHKNS